MNLTLIDEKLFLGLPKDQAKILLLEVQNED